MEEKDVIKVKIKVSRITFEREEFKIVKFEKLDDKKIITVKGIFPELIYGMTYSALLEPVRDPKWGMQYNLVSLNSSYNLKDKAEAKKFLSYFLTTYQLNTLFTNCDDPIKLLEEENVEEITKIKGISERKAKKMIDAYQNNKDNSKLYAKLYDYGISLASAARLLEVYKSADLVIEKINENPYILIDEVEGYGWKKTDAIALNMGVAPTSKFRLQAFIKYYLKQTAMEEGNTWIDLQELRNAFYEVIPEATDEQVREAIKVLSNTFNGKPCVQYDSDTNRICLTRYKDLEQEIAQELKRIQSAPNLVYDKNSVQKIKEEIEKVNGWEFTDEQMLSTQLILDNPVSIVTGGGGCVDCDTEFFNGEKWKKISEWEPEDKVLQYNPETNKASLTVPQRYIKKMCKEFWHIYSSKGLDHCLSDDHPSIYIDRKNKWHLMSTKDLVEKMQLHPNSSIGFSPCAFEYEGKGINLTDAQIKLMCAVICDGSFYASATPNQESYHTCRFHIKKDRKKQKLIEIFEECNLSYRVVNSTVEGYSDLYVKAPIRTKIFSKQWYECSQHQLQVICDNIIFWDGSITKTGSLQFASNVRENIDFVQFAFAACGYRTKIAEFDRKGKMRKAGNKEYPYKTIEYRLNIAKNNKISYTNYNYRTKTTGVDRYKSKDGYKYCFTVPTSYFIARRNGSISILHNSGKTSSLQLATTILSRGHSYSIAQTALSGRAASRMSEITGLGGQTIHRLLNICPPLFKPAYDRSKPLEQDIVILDETSMVDGEIFVQLLRAIKTGAKLVMLGDVHQLEAIGLCNLLKDMIESGQIPYIKLEKIHRQAAKSGILSTASLVKDGKQIIPSLDYTGEQTLGELQDLDLVVLDGNTYTQEVVIDTYRKLIHQGISKDDIDIIVPMRKRGAISLNTLNEIVQEMVDNDFYNSITVGSEKEDNRREIFVNDKIIVTKNCYRGARNEEDKEIAIFNGNIGKVLDITDKDIVLDIFGTGKVCLSKSKGDVLDLGYAITCHAKQGSEIPYAIVALDSTCYTLASREWLYTALTRAKKRCILIGQNSTLFKAVRTSSISKKHTWLTEMLKK